MHILLVPIRLKKPQNAFSVSVGLLRLQTAASPLVERIQLGLRRILGRDSRAIYSPLPWCFDNEFIFDIGVSFSVLLLCRQLRSVNSRECLHTMASSS